jgi:hypothetical protein
MIDQMIKPTSTTPMPTVVQNTALGLPGMR